MIDAEKERRIVGSWERRTGSNDKHMDVTGLAVHVGVCMSFHRIRGRDGGMYDV